jgi:hypothetical protein
MTKDKELGIIGMVCAPDDEIDDAMLAELLALAEAMGAQGDSLKGRTNEKTVAEYTAIVAKVAAKVAEIKTADFATVRALLLDKTSNRFPVSAANEGGANSESIVKRFSAYITKTAKSGDRFSVKDFSGTPCIVAKEIAAAAAARVQEIAAETAAAAAAAAAE